MRIFYKVIGIVNYGMGNIFSVQKAINRLGFETCLITGPNELHRCDHAIIPGVGHFGSGMSSLKKLGLIEAIREYASRKENYLLGICLGMQLLTQNSEEGNCSGLGLLDGVTLRFSFPEKSPYRIPHMGWNTIQFNSDFPDLNWRQESKNEFYFVHSYYVKCNTDESVLMKTEYGIEFVSGIRKDNIYGFQFHPEKSHKQGLRLLKTFCELA